jgi:hypothetical protein
MNTLDEMLAVLTAFKQGKQIQFRFRNPNYHDKWVSAACPCWNFESCEYRVRPEPEPRTFYFNEYSDGSRGQCFLSEREALDAGSRIGKIIKVIEVLDR